MAFAFFVLLPNPHLTPLKGNVSLSGEGSLASAQPNTCACIITARVCELRHCILGAAESDSLYFPPRDLFACTVV